MRVTLWELFNHDGKVTRVFILDVNKKPRYKFSTFAFVQFASLRDVDRVIRSTNKSKTDERVIVVSNARFTNTQKENISVIPHTNKKGDKPVGGSIQESNKGATDRYASVVDNMSYKEAFLGKPKGNVANQEGNLQRNEEEKRRRDSLGIPLNFYFPTSDLAWIENALVGEFIYLDELTKKKENFSIANLIIRVESPSNVPKSITVHSEGHPYVIKVLLDLFLLPPFKEYQDCYKENFVDEWSNSDFDKVHDPNEHGGQNYNVVSKYVALSLGMNNPSF
ncbi:hypothetical protein V6N11_082827 [Hibiscus sabdariffa]|uniref:RRM domain-containing protein n=1 Tax=Hibiscus sabdariffa TaxID=183260 RepID=A0ABR2QK19_9ROSI